MKYFISLLLLCLVVSGNAQKTGLKKDTVLVGHLIDTAIQKNYIYTEFSFGFPGRAIASQQVITGGRDFALTLETNFKVGFFPVNRLLVGWTFTPYLTFSNLGIEGFRWSTGPFIRYYIPFYQVKRKNKKLTSPFAMYFHFNAHFGQFNPIVFDRPFDSRFTAGISGGMGFIFKINKNFNINIEFGPRYDFLSSEFSGKFSFPVTVGFNFSFPTKKDHADKKYKQIQSRQRLY